MKQIKFFDLTRQYEEIKNEIEPKILEICKSQLFILGPEVENFEKEILEFFDSSKEMYQREAEIVTEEFLKLEETYNLKIGGEGGWDYVHNDLNRKEKISNGQKKSYKNPNRKTNKNKIHISNNQLDLHS